jgi:membrane-associated protease RseP (regulator of RpoE activity)
MKRQDAADTVNQPPPLATVEPVSQPPQRRVLMPLLLFIGTCVSTYLVGGPAFSAALMLTLLAHELGHFFQAHRYRVPASLPYFIPMPASPIGTMGAVIVMQPRVGDRRSLFDIAVTGPVAGLVPALIFSIIGLQWSEVVETGGRAFGLTLGEPLLFKLLAYFTFGHLPDGQDVALHPVAYAGWVGIFITALNLIPIGQLDGGHILYALLLRRAHSVARILLAAAMLGVIIWGYWGWTLMIVLLFLMGTAHPPTANDHAPLGSGRRALGWAALLFVPLGFTPVPFTFAG